MFEKRDKGFYRPTVPLPVLEAPVIRGPYRFTKYTEEYISIERELAAKENVMSSTILKEDAAFQSSTTLVERSTPCVVLDGVSFDCPVEIVLETGNAFERFCDDEVVTKMVFMNEKVVEDFIGNTGMALSVKEFQKMDCSSYVIAPKIDGLRSIVYLEGNSGRAVARDGSQMYFRMSSQSSELTVLDCEFLVYEENPVFVILDAYVLLGDSKFSMYDQWDRMRRIKGVKFNSPDVEFVIQDFREMNTLSVCMSNSRFRCDGIVFVKRDSLYIAREHSQSLKFWKSFESLTVDLLFRQQETMDEFFPHSRGPDGLEVFGEYAYDVPCEGVYECFLTEHDGNLGVSVFRSRPDKVFPNSTRVVNELSDIFLSKFDIKVLFDCFKYSIVKRKPKKPGNPRHEPIEMNLPKRSRTFFGQRAFRVVADRRKMNENYVKHHYHGNLRAEIQN